MALIVQKFGGSSVADNEGVRRVAGIIAKTAREGNSVIAVVSAQGKTTDRLIEKAKSISPQTPGREMDMLLATGEQASCALVAAALHEIGCRAVSLCGWQAGFNTDDTYMAARIAHMDTTRVETELRRGNVVVAAGFQGVSEQGDITTLGRGGSDTSAVALAASLGADRCQIFTDVDGVYSADPHQVPTARRLPLISYDEMLELASLGAKVLNHRSVALARKFGVELEVLSSLQPGGGTIVKEVIGVESLLVSGVAKDMNTAVITLYGLLDGPGIASAIFSALGGQGINVDLITLARAEGMQTISFTVPLQDADTAMELLEVRRGEELDFAQARCDKSVAKVSIVGGGMHSHAGVAAAMFRALAENGVNIQLISTSEIKISVLVAKEQADDAVAAIHDTFFPA